MPNELPPVEQRHRAELLPCPLCTGDELSFGYSSPGIDGSASTGEVQCHSCDLLLWRPTQTEAIAAWNTRPTPASAGDAGDVEEAITLIREAKTTLGPYSVRSAKKPLPHNANTAIHKLARAIEILAALNPAAQAPEAGEDWKATLRYCERQWEAERTTMLDRIAILRRALAWHGDPARMATTREEWQQEVDAAIAWVKAFPEADRPSFSSYAHPPATPEQTNSTATHGGEPGEAQDVSPAHGATPEPGQVVACPKCGSTTSNDWQQCEGSCPMPASPFYAHPPATPQPVEDEPCDTCGRAFDDPECECGYDASDYSGE